MSTALLDRHAPAGTLFRLATAGSVDDGKSTLVGRLLHDSKAVLADQRRFSNDIRPYVGAAGASVGGLGFTDPPEHTRLRALLTPEFTMRRINRLAPRIEAIVDAGLAKRQTASKWLSVLAQHDVLERQQLGRSVVYLNRALLDTLAEATDR